MEWPTGQERRAWLDRKGQAALDAIQYYLGPGVNVGGIATIADALNPVADMTRAGTAARGAVQPGLTASERAGYVGSALTDMASVLAPVAGAAYADDAARGLTEGLANLTMPADDMAARFFVDEDGAIRAWHGSPHDFDRFSMDKIGTGEGAQAYGHGLYFAENPGIAKHYRDALSNKIHSHFELGGKRLSPRDIEALSSPDGGQANAVQIFLARGDVQSALRNGNENKFRAAVREHVDRMNAEAAELSARAQRYRDNPPIASTYSADELAERAEWAQRRADEVSAFSAQLGYNPEKSAGRLYEVNIDANPEDFLDWDAPLSAQPESVRQILEPLLPNPDAIPADEWGVSLARARAMQFPQNPTGGDFIRQIPELTGEDLERSLREAGIPGIRYLDAGSRGAGDGSRNYVVFDDRLVDILGKDGQRTTPQGKAQDVLDLLTSGRASEVTDDMLAAADPQYLYRNYDLPMDEASRMARAREMGFDGDWYHGSTFSFDRFGGKTHNPEGHFGAGHYFTSNADDAAGNYAGDGPDLTLRIESRAEQLQDRLLDQFEEKGRENVLQSLYRSTGNLRFASAKVADMDDADAAYDAAMQLARTELRGPTDGVVYPTMLRRGNNFDVESGRYVEADYPNVNPADYLDEAGGDMDFAEELAMDARYELEPEGPLADFLLSLQNNPQLDSADDVVGRIGESLFDGGMSSTDLDKVMRGEWYAYDDLGNLTTNEVYRQALQDAGFDSVTHDAAAAFPRMKLDEDTRHSIVFDPANIRSRFARFDPRLAHLRNLSAGLGGLAALPILEQEMRAYLDSLPES